MKRFFCFVFLLACCVMYLKAQAPHAFVVVLKDKDTVNYSLSRPEQFLSPRAIAKRQRFQVPVKPADLPVNQSYIDTLSHLDSNMHLITLSKWFNYVVVGTYDSLKLILPVLEKIYNYPWVSGVYPLYALPDSLYRRWFSEACSVQPLSYKRPSALEEHPSELEEAYWGKSASQLAALNGLFLHRLQYTGKGMLIALLDNGFLKVDSLQYFASFRDAGRLQTVRDMVDLKADLFSEAGSHGMMVLSIMAINEPYDYIGSAPDADYLLIRTEADKYEDRLEEFFWVAGAEFADSMGVDVLNSSLGYSVFDDWLQNHSVKDLDGRHSVASIAAERLTRTTVVNISAGNEGEKPWHLFSIPSDAPSVLSVAAMNTDSIVPGFSSKGDSLLRKPDITSVGWGTAYCSTDDTIRYGNGTSFSAPLNSGLTACLWQAFPEINPKEVMQAVRRSAHLYPQFDTAFGYGIPDYEKAYQLLKEALPVPSRQPFPEVRLYPNPADQLCRISMAEGGEAELFNALGQSCLRLSLSDGETQLSLAHLPDGLYWLYLRHDGKQWVKKLQIIHAR